MDDEGMLEGPLEAHHVGAVAATSSAPSNT
jgi:hypothetical protein